MKKQRLRSHSILGCRFDTKVLLRAMLGVECLKCGQELQPGFRYCPNCAAPIPVDVTDIPKMLEKFFPRDKLHNASFRELSAAFVSMDEPQDYVVLGEIALSCYPEEPTYCKSPLDASFSVHKEMHLDKECGRAIRVVG